ncbi:UNVERIFIED_CONTAM: hypothetical protein FKN15_053638 [Acipenser sinensis]
MSREWSVSGAGSGVGAEQGVECDEQGVECQPCSQPRATVSVDNAALGCKQASPQCPASLQGLLVRGELRTPWPTVTDLEAKCAPPSAPLAAVVERLPVLLAVVVEKPPVPALLPPKNFREQWLLPSGSRGSSNDSSLLALRTAVIAPPPLDHGMAAMTPPILAHGTAVPPPLFQLSHSGSSAPHLGCVAPRPALFGQLGVVCPKSAQARHHGAASGWCYFAEVGLA